MLADGKELKSWFYSDNEQDATNRIKVYMGARLISLEEIDDPLDILKKQEALDKIREEIAKKKQQEYADRQNAKLREDNE